MAHIMNQLGLVFYLWHILWTHYVLYSTYGPYSGPIRSCILPMAHILKRPNQLGVPGCWLHKIVLIATLLIKAYYIMYLGIINLINDHLTHYIVSFN